MTLLYIDVSHHDRARRGAPLDWPAIKSVTSPVMCARATYGDPSGFSPDTFFFAEFQQGARAAGFDLRGGYHNLVRGDSASMRRQVDWFRRELDSQGCDWAMLDIERYKELVERDLWPRWDDVLRFRDAWHAVERRPLAYYLPKWLWSGYYGTDLRQLPGPLVQSHYLSGIYGSPLAIYNAGGGDGGTGWDDWYGNRFPDIWQYSATCDVAGASSQTDVNAFRGTLDQLRALLTGDDMSAERTAYNADRYAWLGVMELRPEVDGIRIDDADPNKTITVRNALAGVLAQVVADMAELKARPPVQPAPVDPAVLKAVLLDPQVLAAIARAVTDEIGS